MSAFRKKPSLLAATPPPDVRLPGVPFLEFQPAVNLTTGHLIGFEALLRWTNGAGGSIPPDILIPWAEDRGAMTAINAWVLTEACLQAASWPADLQLAVNCSVFQLRRREAAIAAASALEQSELDPNRLTIEVTEDSVTDAEAISDLHALHRLGIQVALDDAGPNSSVLRRPPTCAINTIKIDASLVADVVAPQGPTRTVIETMVTMSKSLGISTVAEAVETAEQVAALRELSVDIAQGYYFSRPLSVADTSELAEQNPLPMLPIVIDAPDELSAESAAIDTEKAEDDPAESLDISTSLRDEGPHLAVATPIGPRPPAIAPLPSTPEPDLVKAAMIKTTRPAPLREDHTVGPVPLEGPVPINRKPVSTTAPPAEASGDAPVSDTKLEALTRGIERLVTVVDRLNELLEPALLRSGALEELGTTDTDRSSRVSGLSSTAN
jgi:EAL domain-containing protein (putative c-di-GMP-specific phosphodiesterase class I)